MAISSSLDLLCVAIRMVQLEVIERRHGVYRQRVATLTAHSYEMVGR